MIDVRKFARLGDLKVQFGVDTKRTAAALRDFADRLDRGDVFVAEINVLSEVKAEDFVIETLVIEFAPPKLDDAANG